MAIDDCIYKAKDLQRPQCLWCGTKIPNFLKYTNHIVDLVKYMYTFIKMIKCIIENLYIE